MQFRYRIGQYGVKVVSIEYCVAFISGWSQRQKAWVLLCLFLFISSFSIYASIVVIYLFGASVFFLLYIAYV